MPTEVCPRCTRDRPNVGPWKNPETPQWTRLCGVCKIELALARPGAMQALRDRVRAGVAQVLAERPLEPARVVAPKTAARTSPLRKTDTDVKVTSPTRRPVAEEPAAEEPATEESPWKK